MDKDVSTKATVAGATVQRLRRESDTALDPVVALGLIVVVMRPDEMGVLGELLGETS